MLFWYTGVELTNGFSSGTSSEWEWHWPATRKRSSTASSLWEPRWTRSLQWRCDTPAHKSSVYFRKPSSHQPCILLEPLRRGDDLHTDCDFSSTSASLPPNSVSRRFHQSAAQRRCWVIFLLLLYVQVTVTTQSSNCSVHVYFPFNLFC